MTLARWSPTPRSHRPSTDRAATRGEGLGLKRSKTASTSHREQGAAGGARQRDLRRSAEERRDGRVRAARGRDSLIKAARGPSANRIQGSPASSTARRTSSCREPTWACRRGRLKEAQALGYAEADPTSIRGVDPRKDDFMSAIAFGVPIQFDARTRGQHEARQHRHQYGELALPQQTARHLAMRPVRVELRGHTDAIPPSA